jgi:hypothetical protein
MEGLNLINKEKKLSKFNQAKVKHIDGFYRRSAKSFIKVRFLLNLF